GQYAGLLDPAILARKAAEEEELRRRIDSEVSRKASYGAAWEQIAGAQQALCGFEKEYALLEQGHAFDSQLFTMARHLVRLAVERPKPNSRRLREYRESNVESLEFSLFSPAPIHAELERAKLAGSLAFLAEQLGGDHPLVTKVLAGKAPAARAADLVDQCTLADVAERRRIAAAGERTIEGSRDPMVGLVRLIDGEARNIRKRHEDEVEEVERQAFAKI